MSPIYLATLALGYALGVLSTIAAYRYQRRRRRRMPLTPRPENAVSAFIRRHAVFCVLVAVGFALFASVLSGWGYYRLSLVVAQQGNDEAKSQARIDCQRVVNNQLLRTLHNRAEASREAILAPQPFVHTLLPLLTSPNATDEERHRMFQALIRATREASETYDRYRLSQQLNPLPALPDCSKGEQ